jgi:hypothetical protein
MTTNKETNTMAAQINLTGAQAESLREVLTDHNDGDEVALTWQGGGDLVVAHSLATVTIDQDGEVVE